MFRTTIMARTSEGLVPVDGSRFEHRAFGVRRTWLAQDGTSCKILDLATGMIVCSFESEMLGWMMANARRKPNAGIRVMLAKRALDAAELKVPPERFAAELAKWSDINKVGR